MSPKICVDGAARIQINNLQLEIGSDFTLPPLASNEVLNSAAVPRSSKNTGAANDVSLRDRPPDRMLKDVSGLEVLEYTTSPPRLD